MNKFSKKIYKLLSSKGMSLFVILFFIFESAWIAISATFPQAFDEDFHFGIIKVYSHHWSPFLSSQPVGANAFGAVARDPSYLYQYIMSFPYRIIANFTSDQLIQVISLRFINIALMVAALMLSYKLLRRTGTSKILTNIILLLFILIPIVPQLSAQINYDNLLIPIIVWSFLLSFNLIDQIKSHKPTFKTSISFLIVGLIASLVKYVYLPIFLAIVIFLTALILVEYKKNLPKFLKTLFESFKVESNYIKIALLGLFILFIGMFIQRDFINLIEYHNVAPNCSQVLSVNQCSAYGPWEFNYINHNILLSAKSHGQNPINGPIYYTGEWLYWMWYRLFFAVNGPISVFTNYPPLPLPSAAALGIFSLSVILFIRYFKNIFQKHICLILLFSSCLFYILVLYLQGFATYRYTNILENMNGRYLLPVMIPLVAVFIEGYVLALKKYHKIKVILAIIVLLLFIEGGGFFTFIQRSDDSWDIPNKTIRQLNNGARHVTSPIIINGNKYYWTNTWFFN
ncbi:MAG: phospholipid carrier-dependent glycosyltransferase [bacterium]